MRNHQKLRAFQLADELTIMVYTATSHFPREEIYGLASQMRRAAVSVPSNIVEGCARNTEAAYLRFLDIAFGSLRELHYQLTLAIRLHYIDEVAAVPLKAKTTEAEKTLNALIRALRK